MPQINAVISRQDIEGLVQTHNNIISSIRDLRYGSINWQIIIIILISTLIHNFITILYNNCPLILKFV